MKKKIAIVTGADKKYFPYLKNLVHSLQKSKTLEICDLCILLIDDDNKYLTDIDYLFNNKKKVSFSLKLFFKDKENWYKLLTERPFLKDHFPGYEKYIWLDADTEVLDVQGINNLITATEKNDLAISPEINESYVFKNTKFGVKKFFLLSIKSQVGHLKIITSILGKIWDKTYFLSPYLTMEFFV